jgi:hypothetical protein
VVDDAVGEDEQPIHLCLKLDPDVVDAVESLGDEGGLVDVIAEGLYLF